MTHARDALERGVRSGEICGCPALVDRLSELRGIAASAEETYDDRAQQILDAEDGFEDMIQECHH